MTLDRQSDRKQTGSRKSADRKQTGGAAGRRGSEEAGLGPVSGLQVALWPLQLQGSQVLKAPSVG